MRRYCSTRLAQIEQEVLSFCAWGDGWTAAAPAWKLMMLLEEAVAPPVICFYAHIKVLALNWNKCISLPAL